MTGIVIGILQMFGCKYEISEQRSADSVSKSKRPGVAAPATKSSVSRPSFREIATELKSAADFAAPNAMDEALAIKTGVNSLDRMRRTAALYTDAHRLILALAPVEAQVRCMVTDLESME